MPAIHVALTFDDKYWAPAYATMRSICTSTERRKDLVFHLLHRPLSAEHEETLRRIETEFGAHLDFHLVDKDDRFTSLLARAPHDARPSIMYARLLLASVLPADAERVVYFDCDMLIRAPIERLAELDLEGKALAAAPDYLGQLIMTGRDLIDTRGIFDPAMRYFNSGLLVIDVAKWRAAKVVDRFEEKMADGTMQELYFDQDLLNLIFRGDWLELSQLWNFIDPRPWHEQLNPHVLHYTGLRKPWQIRKGAAFARVYRYTMTNDVFYRYLAERSPAWLRPFVRLAKRFNG